MTIVCNNKETKRRPVLAFFIEVAISTNFSSKFRMANLHKKFKLQN